MATANAEALIRAARARSNRGIAERNPHMVAESLDKDFLVIVGDGTLLPTREAYVEAFRAEFASAERLTYVRTTGVVEVSASHPLASEQGHWTANRTDGSVAFTGSYAAVWRRTSAGWKLRSECFVTLAASEQES